MPSEKKWPWPIIGLLTILGGSILLFTASFFWTSLLSSVYFRVILGILAVIGPGTFLVYCTAYSWHIGERLVMIALYSMLITTSVFFIVEKIIVPFTPVILVGTIIATNGVMAIAWFITKQLHHHRDT